MTRPLPRLILLALAAVAALGSSTTPRRQPASSGATPGGNNPNYPAAGATYYCYTLETGTTTTSECAPSLPGCDRARQASVADGLNTSDCVTWAPVACFQLDGAAGADAELCAANVDDCEIWRQIDLEGDGVTGDACTVKQ